MRVLAFEPFDERGSIGCDGALLTAVQAWLGSERGESIAAITQRPLQQGVHRDRAARGVRNVVKAGGDLLGAPRQFAARQRFQYQRGDESIAEQGDLFGFVVVHRVRFFSWLRAYGERRRDAMQMVCGEAQDRKS